EPAGHRLAHLRMALRHLGVVLFRHGAVLATKRLRCVETDLVERLRGCAARSGERVADSGVSRIADVDSDAGRREDMIDRARADIACLARTDPEGGVDRDALTGPPAKHAIAEADAYGPILLGLGDEARFEAIAGKQIAFG